MKIGFDNLIKHTSHLGQDTKPRIFLSAIGRLMTQATQGFVPLESDANA